jgi:hypothetical protein
MKRSILFLNLLLLAALVAGSMELRRRWLEARSREAALLAVRPVPPATAQPTPAPPPGKLQSAQYFEVAERFLFSRDRNPNVVIEPKPKPPEKVMPNFPSVHGVLDVGMGPTVYMSMSGEKDKQQGYRPGDKVGEFTLRAATQKEVTFEWEAKSITKTIDELRPKLAEAAPQANTQRMNSNVNNNPPPAPPQRPPENVRPAPGADIGGGRKGCIAGDTSPAGTVVDGYKKVSYAYAFGPICYWESSR